MGNDAAQVERLLGGKQRHGACGGCQSVDFTEKEALGSRLMALDEDPSEVNFQHKSTDSREGSVGARGGSTGGGCGCY